MAILITPPWMMAYYRLALTKSSLKEILKRSRTDLKLNHINNMEL